MKYLRSFLRYGQIFYRFTRWRLFLLIALILVGGLLEALGIITLLPLISLATGALPDNRLAESISTAISNIGVSPTLPGLIVFLLVIFGLKALVVFGQTYLTARVTIAVRQSMQIDLTRKLCAMSYPFYTENKIGHFNNVLITETQRFSAAFRLFSQMIVLFIYTLLYIPMIAALQTELAVVLFIIGPIGVIGFYRFVILGRKLSIEVSQNNSALNSEFIQLISSFVYLKATGLVTSIGRHVATTISRLARLDLRLGLHAAILAAAREPIAVSALLGYVYYEVVLQSGSLAEVLTVAIVLYRLLGQILTWPGVFQRFSQQIGGIQMVSELNRQLDDNREESGPEIPRSLDGGIVFEDVSLRLGGTRILENIDLSIEPNQTIAVVGESGAGKTSFFYLLTGLLRPTSGRIHLGGTEYKDLDFLALRDLIGFVTQDPIVLNDTVANNINCWQCEPDNQACNQRVESAAAAADCANFIADMTEGYETVLGDRGIRLSGGQRQRIAIARELFKDPPLLIFDEATSALDAQSESNVQESIARLKGERTVIIIAHRLSTVRLCDYVYVFSHGRIAERGTVKALYHDDDSLFHTMCVQQGITL